MKFSICTSCKPYITDDTEKKSLLQRSGEIISNVLTRDMQTSETETEIELNLAMIKIKHKVKKNPKI